MHDSTLDLFAKVGIDANDIEKFCLHIMKSYYEVTCDYYNWKVGLQVQH